MSNYDVFNTQLDEILYEIFQSDEFISYMDSLVRTTIESPDEYYFPEDLTYPVIIEEEEYEEDEEKEEPTFIVKKYNCDEMGNQECSICLVDFEDEDDYVDLKCKHVFHETCLKEWVVRKMDCPNCREKIKS